MREIELGEVARIETGTTPSTKNPDYHGGNIPFVKPGDLDEEPKIIFEADSYVTDLGAKQGRIIPENGVMVCCIGSLGKLAIAGRDMITNQQINSVIFNEERVYPKFGAYFLSTQKKELEHLASSTTVAIVNKTNFSKLKIPLPTLSKQKAIVAKLDRAQRLIDIDQEMLAKYDELIQSVFLEMFGDPFDGDIQFEREQLNELIDKDRGVSYGVVQRGKHIEDGVPLIRIKDIKKGCFNVDELVRTSKENSDKYSRTILKGGEFLISIRGTVGEVAIAPSYAEGWNITREVAIIPLSSDIDRSYFYHYLKSEGTLRKLLGDVKGVAQSGINLKDLRKLPIAIPPKNLQLDFADKVLKIERSKAMSNQSFSNSKRLFSSLVQGAFG